MGNHKRRDTVWRSEPYQFDDYEYDKTIKQKNSDLRNLQAQAMALQGVTNDAAAAELARINAQIAEAQEDLEDTRMQHSYDIQNEGYSKLSDDANEALDNALKRVEANADEQERVVQMMLNRVKNHYKEAYGEIEGIIAHSGTVISDMADETLNKHANGDADKLPYLKAPYDSETGTFNFEASNAALKINTARISIGTTESNDAVTNVVNNSHEQDLNSVSSDNTPITSNTQTSSKSEPGLVNKQRQDEKKQQEQAANKELVNKLNKFVKSRPEYKVSSEKASTTLSAPQYYIWQKTGHRISEADEAHIARGYLGITGIPSKSAMENGAKLTKTQHMTIYNALKKIGYASGTLGVKNDEYNWTHEGEIIRRSDGAILRQLKAGTQVIPKDASENLLKWASINPTQLMQQMYPIPDMARNTTTVNNHYDSLLTVNGNVDRDALPELKEILKQACEYTNKYNAREARKLGKK